MLTRLLLSLQERLVNESQSFLLLLMLGHLLRPDDRSKLVNLVGILRLLVVQVLLKSCERVLHFLHAARRFSLGAPSATSNYLPAR